MICVLIYLVYLWRTPFPEIMQLRNDYPDGRGGYSSGPDTFPIGWWQKKFLRRPAVQIRESDAARECEAYVAVESASEAIKSNIKTTFWEEENIYGVYYD